LNADFGEPFRQLLIRDATPSHLRSEQAFRLFRPFSFGLHPVSSPMIVLSSYTLLLPLTMMSVVAIFNAFVTPMMALDRVAAFPSHRSRKEPEPRSGDAAV
jgi:hypothetical protein